MQKINSGIIGIWSSFLRNNVAEIESSTVPMASHPVPRIKSTEEEITLDSFDLIAKDLVMDKEATIAKKSEKEMRTIAVEEEKTDGVLGTAKR